MEFDLEKTFRDDFRRFFLRGLAAVLPTVLTIAVIVWVFTLIQDYCGAYINNAAANFTSIIWVKMSNITDPDKASLIRMQVYEFWNRNLFWVGFVFAIIGVYVFGRFIASIFGRVIWRLIERGLIQLPIIKQIYPSIKQVTDFLLTERKMEFSNVVAVEYPRKGIWSLGLVTNSGMRTLQETLPGDQLTVFIPSSPTPVTGYTITVCRDEVIDLPISIDEALRFTISGGVIQPPKQRVGSTRITEENEAQTLVDTKDKENA